MPRVIMRGSLCLLFLACTALAVAQPPLTTDKAKPPAVTDKDKQRQPSPPACRCPKMRSLASTTASRTPWPRTRAPSSWTPKQFQALRDEIAQLRKQLDRPRPRWPSRCVLKGKVEGNLVQFTAEFEFGTEKADEAVRLGCGAGPGDRRQPRRPDPAPPPACREGRARTTRKGFVVEIDKPGEHELTLDLVMAVASKSGEPGLDARPARGRPSRRSTWNCRTGSATFASAASPSPTRC